MTWGKLDVFIVSILKNKKEEEHSFLKINILVILKEIKALHMNSAQKKKKKSMIYCKFFMVIRTLDLPLAKWGKEQSLFCRMF